jgi:energy-coupling factor transport system ATP-binding protein
MRPYVLILDEPLAGLDAEGRAEVLSTVSTLRQAGTAFLVMTLRPETAAQATRIAFLDGGTLSRPATARSALEQEDVLTRAGLLYPPSRWPDLGPVADSQGNAPAVEIQDLHFQYTEGEEVLRGIDLRISQGQFVALVGPNGAGKSTLVRHLNGLLRATRGTVRVLGQATGNRPTGEIARDVGFLFQRPEQQLFASTVREEIAFGLRRLKRSDPEQHVRRALSRFGLEHLAEHPPALLGYGAQRTVTLASLAALEAPIVVLDEPTVGLDGRGMAQLLDWLADLRRANVTILLVTHELDLAARADRIITLDRGRIVADDKTDRARLTDIQCAEAP